MNKQSQEKRFEEWYMKYAYGRNPFRVAWLAYQRGRKEVRKENNEKTPNTTTRKR